MTPVPSTRRPPSYSNVTPTGYVTSAWTLHCLKKLLSTPLSFQTWRSSLWRLAQADLNVPLPTSMFPSLTSLDVDAIDGTVLPLLPKIITHIQSKTFRTLHLTFRATAPGTFLPTTLMALQQRGLHQTLTTLSVKPVGHFDLDIAFIRPLLFLTELAHLVIEFSCRDRCPYKLSDEGLEELVKAMPKLEDLCFGTFPCSRPTNNTIKSLVAIAKHCKRLKVLVTHTNAEAIVNEMSQPTNWWDGQTSEDPLSVFAGCPLRDTLFGPCPIPNEERGAMAFALTLLRLFPGLQSVATSSLEEDPLWETVNELIATHGRIGANMAVAGKYTILLLVSETR
jgi:hypothetical protein